jgi:hypothetical protein
MVDVFAEVLSPGAGDCCGITLQLMCRVVVFSMARNTCKGLYVQYTALNTAHVVVKYAHISCPAFNNRCWAVSYDVCWHNCGKYSSDPSSQDTTFVIFKVTPSSSHHTACCRHSTGALQGLCLVQLLLNCNRSMACTMELCLSSCSPMRLLPSLNRWAACHNPLPQILCLVAQLPCGCNHGVVCNVEL